MGIADILDNVGKIEWLKLKEARSHDPPPPLPSCKKLEVLINLDQFSLVFEMSNPEPVNRG